ncbi:oxysterol-binding protein-related protein 10 isoform X1 [Hippocampus comes]|uniref:oxysterol-binding protein-related protein 10 isoform X1 n=1 Tax=Hippocampus comes TaxID=109280 RepID=UPI00094F0069|nr:PREDICTED: oxysterol-binding protein-related protein 10-like isoform X1 [Hippocampus comes]XP_019735597.1 PREDICTED: oxysterol-binding protein-related protein 10-like isoform X1 [Hippocampus comes]
MSRSVRQESPARYPEKRQERRVGPLASESRHCGAGSSPQQQHLEGVLRKYTNLLQGWQNRYFVLDPEVSRLDYYRNEHNKSQRPPRGSLSLLGARVVSAGDFPYMFVIQSPTGEAYKLRASNAAEQELWMTKLQLCSRYHSYNGAKVMTEAQGEEKILVNSNESLPPRSGPLSSLNEDLLFFKATSAATLSCLGECFTLLHHSIQAHNQNQNHHSMSLSETPCAERVKSWNQRCSSSVHQVEPGSLKSSNESPIHSGSDKQSPKHCSYTPGQEKDHNNIQSHEDSSTEWISSPQKQMTNDALKPAMFSHRSHRIEQGKWQPSSLESLDPSDETTDTEDNDEEDLGVIDEQRSIIRHLLSQLKLGMDLTKVALPTFILEKRSLLEMYANFMAHPDMFLSITTGTTSEERIIRFVEYYLTAFHEGRKGAVAKKPYNPILGETFHCTWCVPRECVRSLRATNSMAPKSAAAFTSPTSNSSESCSGFKSDCYQVRFVAEQVSHHPPVSGFYYECKEKRMCVNTHVWTKSKFLGMSVGVSMVGEGVLHLLEHNEDYVFTLPCAYARSILAVPWVELGGKVTISCAKTGYSATVTFHTKPFYGGKVHRVTAEVKHNQTGNIVCKVQGEWNGVLEFTYSNGESKVIDTSKLPVIKKKIRPIEKQEQNESRRLWQHVTASLRAGRMDDAAEHKHRLEDRQRIESKQRSATKTPWKPKHFIKEGDGWVYHNPLWKVH